MSNNYPDNIRDFDNHPSSPFYEEAQYRCTNCCDLFEEDEGKLSDVDEEGYTFYCSDCWTKEY